MFKLEHPRIKTQTDRQYPRYYPGMTTAEYVHMYHWYNQLKSPKFHFVGDKS